MKHFKTSLHVMLTIASLLGFMGGWATLAHSRKPAQATESQTLDALAPLEPLPAIGSNTTSRQGNRMFTFTQQPSRPRPSRSFFATSGS